MIMNSDSESSIHRRGGGLTDRVSGGLTEFSQREELTTRLRNILHEYPPGLGAFNEFLQNADDAGARSFAVLLATAGAGAAEGELLHPALEAFEGPALYFYNSATFSERDFASISSIGLSGKGADASSIGRYGLGFNVAYHFTDVPTFVSRKTLVMFDPHGTHLPGGMCGLRANFAPGEDSALARGERFSRTMDGFRAIAPLLRGEEATAAAADGSGDVLRSGFDGTLFRLPLRTAAQAAASKITATSYSVDEASRLLREFASSASELLLFLQNVENIAVYECNAHDPARRLVRVHVANATDALREHRAAVSQRAKARGASAAAAEEEEERAYELIVRTVSDDAAVDDATWLVEAAAPTLDPPSASAASASSCGGHDPLAPAGEPPTAGELRFLESAVQV